MIATSPELYHTFFGDPAPFLTGRNRTGILNFKEENLKSGWRIKVSKKITLIALLLTAFPVWGNSPQQDQVIEIRVAKGDTLWAISQTYLKDPLRWAEIARLNNLPDANTILPGQILLIPVKDLKSSALGGRVSFIHGRGEILPPGFSEWKPVTPGDRVPPGSQIRTLESGVLEIVFENEDSFYLRPETTIGVTAAGQEKAGWVTKIFLRVGKLIGSVRRATGAQSRVEILTPSAQCAVRGTVFRAAVDEEERTLSEVLEGLVAVEASGSSVDVQAGQGTLVRKGEAPLTPRLLLAAPSPIGVPALATAFPFPLDFTAAPGTVAVVVDLTRDPDGRDLAWTSVWKPGQALLVQALEDGVYYLQARAIDDLGLEGMPLQPQEIRVRTQLHAPRFLDLAAGASFRCNLPALRWEAVAGAKRYKIQASADPGFARLAGQAEIETPVWTSAPLPPGEYFLRAQSVAEDGFEGQWSEAVKFVILPAYTAPRIEKPLRDDKRVLVRWSDAGPGLLYQLQLSRERDFKTIMDEQVLREPSAFVDEPVNAGVYHLRVKAYDESGCSSPFSLTQSFRVGSIWARWWSPFLWTPVAVLIYILTR